MSMNKWTGFRSELPESWENPQFFVSLGVFVTPEQRLLISEEELPLPKTFTLADPEFVRLLLACSEERKQAKISCYIGDPYDECDLLFKEVQEKGKTVRDHEGYLKFSTHEPLDLNDEVTKITDRPHSFLKPHFEGTPHLKEFFEYIKENYLLSKKFEQANN